MMMRVCLFLLAGLCWTWDIARAQRSRSHRVGSGGSRGYYSSFGRSSSGRRWNNGAINSLNAPSYKGLTSAHLPLSAHYVSQQRVDFGKTGSRFRHGSRGFQEEDTEVSQTTEEYTIDATEATDLTAAFGGTEPSFPEGLFMRRLRPPSGPHIVRDSWCRVSESKDCVPAL